LNLVVLRELKRDDAAAACQRRLDHLQTQFAIEGRLKLQAHDEPRDVPVRWELWLWCKKNGQLDEGFVWLTEILRIDPQNARAHAALADYFEQAGQPRRAAQHRAAANLETSKS
jgi:hypothetical protein